MKDYPDLYQRTTSYVVCTAHSDGCTLLIRRSMSSSNPSKRRLPAPRTTGAVEITRVSTTPAASACRIDVGAAADRDVLVAAPS